MSSYSDKLRDPRWQRKRLEIMQRDGFKCQECGRTTETLHVHHLRYPKGVEPWDVRSELLVTLCHYCHEEMHSPDGLTALECLLASVMRLGGSFETIWALVGYLDSIQGTRKFSIAEWFEAFRACTNVLEHVVEERSDG